MRRSLGAQVDWVRLAARQRFARLRGGVHRALVRVIRSISGRDGRARWLARCLPRSARAELEAVWALQPTVLFDPEWYLAQNPEVRAKGKDPYAHYVRIGARRGLDPHPWFDTDWYLLQYPDVAAAGVNPLVHYITWGMRQNRMPHPNFDPDYYVALHPEAAPDPLAHFLAHGLGKGWRTRAGGNIADYLPVKTIPESALPRALEVAIVVPVYRGLEETRACLTRVAATMDRQRDRLLVIDDGSPEPELSAWLQEFGQQPGVEVLVNERNLGFVATANRGMRAGGSGRDVILLNSDTEVPPGWVERLGAQAYADPRIGTVTPFSNNATICSYPGSGGGPMPEGFGLDELDDACRAANASRSVELPTAVGFCMYIRHDCLAEVGLFDVERFGRGYGEENDFCLRAIAKGWRHVLACDTFVYHAGEVSFGANSPERAASWNVLIERHPDYPGMLARFGRLDPVAPARFAATVELLRRQTRPKVLLITHRNGGGVERHVNELAELPGACFLKLVPRGQDIELSVPRFAGHPSLVVPAVERESLLEVLTALGLDVVHVHHVLGHQLDVGALVRELNAPMDLTIHDYFYVCPQITFLHDGDHYCGEPDMAACNACIARRPSYGAMDILSWRMSHAWLFRQARRIICPSEDVRRRLLRYGVDEPMLVVPHEPVSDPLRRFRIAAPKEGEPLRVAVLGLMAAYKGLAAFSECVALDKAGRCAFAIIGRAMPPLPGELAARVMETGQYSDDQLQELIERLDPHVIWFPAPWPETYSYTLSAAIESGRPILATRIGAFPERLAGRPWTWLADADAPPRRWLSLFEEVRARLAQQRPPEAGTLRPVDREDFYRASYLPSPAATPAAPVELRRADRTSVVILPEKHAGQWSPCAYIRLLLPATHPDLADAIKVSVVEDVAEAIHCRADVILTQRTAIEDIEGAHTLVEHARGTGARLVYDLDDNLLELDSEHVDRSAIERRLAPIRFLLGEADLVTASTAPLRSVLQRYNPQVELVENVLDDRLWGDPAEVEVKDGSVVRVLYMGTATHGQDLALIAEACRGIKAEFGGKVSFEIVGVTSGNEFGDWADRIVPAPHAMLGYPAFVHWLRDQRRWHIGVAPLVDSPFARCKSGIKVLDYTALGMAVAASDVAPYRSVIVDGESGLLVPPTLDGWRDSLRLLVTKGPLRRKLATEAHRRLIQSPAAPSVHRAWLRSLTTEAPKG